MSNLLKQNSQTYRDEYRKELKSVSLAGSNLSHCKFKSTEITLAAIENDPMSVLFSEENLGCYSKAVMLKPEALRGVPVHLRLALKVNIVEDILEHIPSARKAMDMSDKDFVDYLNLIMQKHQYNQGNEAPSSVIAALQFLGPRSKFIDGTFSQFVEYEFWKRALRIDGRVLRFVDNQTKELQSIALKSDPRAIEFVTNPTEQMYKNAVRAMGHTIKYINNPSYELQLIAVSQDPYAILYIESPTEELQSIAVNKCPQVFTLLETQTSELAMLAVSKQPSIVQYINEPNDDICMAAIRTDPFAMTYIKNKPVEFYNKAIAEVPTAIIHIEDPNIEQLESVVKMYPNILDIFEIKDPYYWYRLARKNRKVLEFIPESIKPAVLGMMSSDLSNEEVQAIFSQQDDTASHTSLF